MTYKSPFGGEYQVALSRSTYKQGNRTALQLFDVEDGMPFATCTVNLPEEPMEENEVAIKNHSENTGILDFLVENSIVDPPHRYVNSGFVTFPVCRLK
jgi:hypothetical protein